MRLLFTLQYLGTRYAGWQRQANAIAVQQVVEEALSKMFGTSIHVEGTVPQQSTQPQFGTQPRSIDTNAVSISGVGSATTYVSPLAAGEASTR